VIRFSTLLVAENYFSFFTKRHLRVRGNAPIVAHLVQKLALTILNTSQNGVTRVVVNRIASASRILVIPRSRLIRSY